MAVDVTALNAALGAYAREHVQEIFLDAIYRPEDNPDGMMNPWNLIDRRVMKDQLALTDAVFDLEVEEADCNFNDQGDVVTFDGRVVQLRRMQSSFKICVDEVEGTYLQHLFDDARHDRREAGDLTPGVMPFAQWLIENLIARFLEKFLLNASFGGSYTADFGYGTGSFGASVDGILKVLRDHRTASEIPAAQQVATGAITNTNAYDGFEAMGRAIPNNLFYKDMFLFCSIPNADNYNQDYRSTFGGNSPSIYDKYKRTRLDDRPLCSIMPTPEMGTDGLVFMTPANNLVWASNFDRQPPEILTAVADPMNISVTIRYAAAFYAKQPRQIIINDVV